MPRQCMPRHAMPRPCRGHAEGMHHAVLAADSTHSEACCSCRFTWCADSSQGGVSPPPLLKLLRRQGAPPAKQWRGQAGGI